MHTAVVRRVERLTPKMLRVRIVGAGASGWRGTGVPDEYVPVVFPPVPASARDVPGGVRRIYSVASEDAERDELVIDIVDHPGGLACAWAATARPGDRLLVGEPHATFAPPADTAGLVLAGDVTALPAITRILAGLPETMAAYAVLEVPDAAERRTFSTAAELSVSWHYTGPEAGDTRLPERLAALSESPAGPGPTYWWVAGEAAATRAVRRQLRHERGVPKDYWTVFGYWRHRAEAWRRDHAGLERAAWDAVDSARRSGRAGEELLDVYDDTLDAGLGD